MRAFEKLPALKYALILIAGVAIGAYYYFNPFIIFFIILITAIVIYFLHSRHNESVNEVLIFLIIFLTGIFKITLDFRYSSSDSIKNIPPTLKDSEVLINGIISQPPQTDSNKIKFILECHSVVSQKDSQAISGDILVYIFPNPKLDSGKALPELDAGDEISAYGRLMFPKSERNPGDFDYKKYLELHNISRIFYIKGFDNYSLLSENNLSFIFDRIIYPVRTYSVKLIDSTIQNDEGAFLNGLVTGERKDISEDFKEKFINAGVMHLIAVSGLNVGYVIIFLTLFLSFFRIKLIPKTIILLLALVFYCAFTGATPSILRASLMGGFVLIAYVIQRKVSLLNLTGFSIIIIILFDARQLFDAGFILSYSAIFSMALFFDVLINLVPDKIKKNKFLFTIIVVLLTTVAAQIGTLPISASYFGKISLVSFITNIIAIPISNFSLMLGFLQLIIVGIAKLFYVLTNLLSEDFASFIFTILNFPSVCVAEINLLLLKLQLIFIYFFGGLKYAYTTAFNLSSTGILLYFIIILLLFTSKRRNLLFRLTFCALIILIFNIFKPTEYDKLKIVFFDVGEGDCTLVTTPKNKHILIDTGPEYGNTSAARRIIVPYLNRKGINKIDYLIISHPHTDHTGGLDYLASNIEIENFISSERTMSVKGIYTALENTNCKRRVIFAGDKINIEKDLNIYFLNPQKSNIKSDDDHSNCLVFKLKYKFCDVLFTGDLNYSVEAAISENAGNFLKADILKVSHHGSKNASSPVFLVKALPMVSVISSGINNRFEHPSPFTLTRLEVLHSDIHRTDLEGAIIYSSDGYTLSSEDWH